jgi:hypothetical protein
MKKHQMPISPSLLSSYACEFAHFSVTIKPGARGEHIKMFIGERRTKKTPIRSRLLGLLIVDRMSRKPQEKASGNERDRTRTPGTERKVANEERGTETPNG